MMVIEITAGVVFGSMALLADGWHMGTHAAALGITAIAYAYARRHADDPGFSFGTGKIGVLGGYTSAVVLAIAALIMAGESIRRFLSPLPIRFDEAILVAVVGLAVNLVSAWLLRGKSHHHHPGGQGSSDRDGSDDHHDHNLRAAYLHVLADALTSILAIAALVAGKYFGWVWMDPLMGVVGAMVILKWSWGLIGDTSRVLLDRFMKPGEIEAITSAIESDADNRITDLHIWPISENRLAAIIAVVTHFPRPPEHYKSLIRDIEKLRHVTVEVIPCDSEPCIPDALDRHAPDRHE